MGARGAPPPKRIRPVAGREKNQPSPNNCSTAKEPEYNFAACISRVQDYNSSPASFPLILLLFLVGK